MRDEASALWTLRKGGVELSCRARLQPYGIEIDLARAGSLVLTRAFATEGEALKWAETKRTAREAEGWEPVPPEPPPRTVS